MTTALQIIDRAYSLIGFKAAGETLSAADSSYALDALNSMIDGWNVQPNFMASVTDVVGTVSAATATIGTSQTFNTATPVRIEDGAFTRISNVDYPMTVISFDDYLAIPLKTTTGTYPDYVYLDTSPATALLRFYPVPASAVSVHIPVLTYVSSFADTSTDYTLDVGYRKAMEYSLANKLSPGIRPVDPMIVRKAASARRAIRRANVVIPQLVAPELALRQNIYAG